MNRTSRLQRSFRGMNAPMKWFSWTAAVALTLVAAGALGCDESGDGTASAETGASSKAASSASPAGSSPGGAAASNGAAPNGAPPDGPSPTGQAGVVPPPSPGGSAGAPPLPPQPGTAAPALVASAPPGFTASPPPALPPAPPAPEPVKLPTPKAGSADAVAADIDKIYVPQKNFEASFDQSQRLKVQGKTVESKGRVFVQKPDKVAFKYINGNIIVSDGVTLKTYVKADEQMVIQNLKGTQAKGAVSFLMGNGIRQSFTFEFHTKPWEPGWVLRGTPREATAHYEHVFFFVDRTFTGRKSAEAMKTVILIDAQGNRNRFDFTRASFPATLRSEVFTFTPPPGTNIVRQ